MYCREMNSGSCHAQRETFSLLILGRLTRNASLVAIKKQSKKEYQKQFFSVPTDVSWGGSNQTRPGSPMLPEIASVE